MKVPETCLLSWILSIRSYETSLQAVGRSGMACGRQGSKLSILISTTQNDLATDGESVGRGGIRAILML